MIDLHTHILPAWDDGAEDWRETDQLCEMAWQDGITKIVLTPHVYRLSKCNNDFGVLERRIAEFNSRVKKSPIDFYRGAEVFLDPDMAGSLRERNLTINGSDYVFIELPSDYIPPGIRDLFFSLMLDGLTPIISHPERNLVFAEHPNLLYEMISAGALGQVTGKSLMGGFGREIKKAADVFLAHNLIHVIASDANDTKSRPPRISQAVQEAAKIVGQEKAMAMVTSIPQAVLDNKPIPDFGDPSRPEKDRSKWSIHFPRKREYA